MNLIVPMEEERLSQRLQAEPTPLALLRTAASQRPDHPAVEYLPDGKGSKPLVVTYGQLLAEVEQLMRALRAAGVGEADGVAILLPIIPQAISSLIAAAAVGVAFPINLLLSAEAMASQMRLARVRVIITMGPHPALDVRARVAKTVELLGTAPMIVEVPVGEASPDGMPWQEFLASGQGDAAVAAKAAEQVAALVHTGGSMGEPKLGQLSQKNLAAGGLMAAAGFGYRGDDRILTGLPMFHVGGIVDVVFAAIAAGATVIYPTALGVRNPEVVQRFWHIVDETRATIVGGVPTMLSAFAASPRGDARLETLRGFVTGGSPLPVELGRRVEQVSGRPVYQLYGMTETAGIATNQFMDGQFHAPSGGKPVPLQEVAIGEPGRPLEAGQTGEIFVRGPNVFLGYRTVHGTEGVPVDGWVGSGDLGEVMESGDIRLVGRTKDVIIRSGHNIDPQLIEEVAVQHPDVVQAAAIAMPDGYAGELPILFVTLAAGADTDPAALSKFVNARIAEPPARPRQVIVLDELPLTPIGKVARYQLRQQAAIKGARQALADIPGIEDVQCTDQDARRIALSWSADASDADRQKAAEALQGLGLSLAD